MIKQTRIILSIKLAEIKAIKSWLGIALLASILAGCSTTPVEPDKAEPKTVAPAALKRAPKIGLALGGGAARGFAHVGVIQVLEEAGVRPSLVAGTSAGSLVAAMYAGGKSGAQLQQVAETMEEAAFADWTLPLFNRGMLRGDALARYVNSQLGGRLIEDLPMPLGIVATDLHNGRSVLFQRGDTGTAVRASSAVPALFQPVRISGRDYVDGGLVSPVPVRSARAMGAELVIAVDISSEPEGNSALDTLDILLQTFSIMSKSINTFELRDADVVIKPSLMSMGSSDFRSRRRAIEAGRVAMLAQLPSLKAKIEQLSR
ncbi:MAG: patatin-like phospholipase family protein [Gammaproteobacteria bacterium]|nr:patatin-like phospholipase family protein [Gammaproteobacteria bacterium]MBU0786362.1 patatin-like phospholipase family protein [Gammaproteobacteria bacterium]MBU0814418.1 patatin-like phospholipase family protein [Gammaproteobacteria bacterium]MBU1786739.1 patatin-like phospholipase family protein [Gammaproteobacteria bacterium]